MEFKVYRIEDNKFVHEQDFIMGPTGFLLPTSQLYGDILVFNNGIEDNDSQFEFYSLSKKTFVHSLVYPTIRYATYSSLEPIMYLTFYDNDKHIVIQRIDCMNFTEEEIYRAKPPFEDSRLYVDLFESNDDEFLRIIYILGLGQDDDVAVQLIDLQKRKLIFSQQYSTDIQQNQPKKRIEYYSCAWSNLKYNSGTPYYSTISKSQYHNAQIFVNLIFLLGGSVVTIGNINDPFNGCMIDGETEPSKKQRLDKHEVKKLPDTPSIFSKHYKGYCVMDSEWLNHDILTFQISFDYRGSRDVPRNAHRLAFFSVSKRAFIGYINDKIDKVFVNGNNIICFSKRNNDEIYIVKLNMSYLQQNESKKRELEADPTLDEHQSKKIKIKLK